MELIQRIGQIMGKKLSERFTGKITITINCKDGGIGSAQIITAFDIQNEPYDNKRIVSD